MNPSNKMNILLRNIETLKTQNNPKRSSILKTNRKYSSNSTNTIRKSSNVSTIKSNRKSVNLTKRNSININKEQTKFIRRNSVTPNKNINTQAIETLSNAALKVKNLLSDFLVNADEDDKEKYNIEDELKQIKENKNNENINIFTLIGNNSGKSSDSDDNINNENDNDNIVNNNNFFNKRKSTKRNSLLLTNSIENNSIQNTNNSLNNDDFFKNKSHSKKSIKTSKQNSSSFIPFVKNGIKTNLKRNSVNIISTGENNLLLNKKPSTQSICSNSSILKKKTKVHFNFIENENQNKKSNDSLSKFNRKRKKKNTFQVNNKMNLMNHLNLMNNKPYNINNNRLSINSNLSYSTNSKNFLSKSKTLKGKNINNSFALSSESDNEIEKEENNNKNSLISYKKDDIRAYVPLSKSKYQKFTDLCKNLRKSIIFNADDIKSNENLISKLERDKKEKLISIDTIKEEEDTINNNNNDNEDSDINDSAIEHNKKIKEFQFRRLTRQDKLVYDSLSDEEVLDDLEGELYIHPDNIFIFIFDAILFVLSIYSITYPIYVFGFKKTSSPPFQSKSLKYFEFIMDFFCITDLIFGFFTAFYDFDEELITNSNSIAIHYLTHWFSIDFISAIPFNSIIVIFQPFRNKLKLRYIKDNSLYDLLILVRVLKLSKVFLHNAFTNKIFKSIEGIDALEKWIRVYMSLFIGFAAIHILSCIFIFLGTLQFPNWIYTNGYEISNQQTDIYVTALYYIVATVFTIGYGDIVSVSLYERVYNLILLVVGIMIYSYSVSALSNYVSMVDSKTLDYQNKIATLEQLRVTHEKMPNQLYDKISKFLLYRLKHESGDKNEIIDSLPNGLRNKLILEMYKDIIYNFIFFKKFYNTDFVIQVILALKPIQALKNEKLVKEGEYIEEILFVKRGILSLEIPLPVILKDETIQKMETIRFVKTQRRFGIKNANLNFLKQSTLSNGLNITPNELDIPSNEDLIKNNSLSQIKDMKQHQQYIKIIEIRRNEHFGDILMFLNKRSPLSVKVKTKVCELFLLKKTDAVEISMNFPKIWRKIIKKSLFNMEQIERLINKTLKFFFVHNEGQRIRRDSVMKKNYYRIDPTKSNKLLNSNNLFQNLNDSGLKSIPSEYTEEEEEEENETIFEENSSNETNSKIEENKNESDSQSDSQSNSDSQSDSDSESNSQSDSQSNSSDNSKSYNSDKNKEFKITINNDDNDENNDNNFKNNNSNYNINNINNKINNKLNIKNNNNDLNNSEISNTINYNTNIILKGISDDNSNKSININEIKDNDTIDLNKEQKNIFIENDNSTKRQFENSFNEEQNTYRSSINTNKTVKTIIKNSIFDIKSINNEKEVYFGFFNDKDKKTLFSSNSLTLPYSLEEINNENLPFEEISLHNEDMPSSIFSPEFSNNYINLNQILAYKPLYKNKPFLFNENNNNLSLNGEVNDIIEFNSIQDKKIFKNLSKHHIISFTIFGIKKFNKKNKKKKSEKSLSSNHKNKNKNKNKEKDKDKEKENDKETDKDKDKNSNKDKNSSSVTDKISENEKDKENISVLNSKNNIIESLKISPKKKIEHAKTRTLVKNDRRLSKMIFSSPSKNSHSESEEEDLNAHRDNFNVEKIFNKKKEIRNSKSLNETNIIEEHKNKIKIKKTDTLDIISQNIENNSINLNNPNKFYSSYFSSIIEKREIKNENGVSNRLNKIKELIQNHGNKNKDNVSTHSNVNSTHSSNIPFMKKSLN